MPSSYDQLKWPGSGNPRRGAPDLQKDLVTDISWSQNSQDFYVPSWLAAFRTSKSFWYLHSHTSRGWWAWSHQSMRKRMWWSLHFSMLYLESHRRLCWALLWNSMRGHDTISQGWLKVSFLIPFLSVGTLYYGTNVEEDGTITFSWRDDLVVGFWLVISMLTTQLGGYLGIHSQPIHMPIVIRKHTLVKNYWAWCLFLALGFLSSVVCYIETYVMAVDALSRTFSTSSKIYIIFMAALGDLLFALSCCSWLTIQKMHLCFGNSDCFWWKSFLTLGVPYGLYAGFRLLFRPP